MPVRMKDLARELGVSIVTISKVLRDHSDISRDTKERVLKRMRELNYRPNLAARALVTGRSHAIGFVVPDLVHSFFSQVAIGLSRILRPKGYSLLIASSEGDGELEQDEIDQMLARQVDVLVLASTQASPESLQRIEQHGTPYLLMDRSFPGWPAHFIGVDDVKVGVLGTTHLIETGRKRIAHISGPAHSTGLGRLEGYRKAMTGHGLEIRDDYIVAGRSPQMGGNETGYGAMKQLLALDPPPDAVYCFNDPMAVGALRAILDAGLRVPADVAVVGSGNVHYADFLRVPLTSVDQDSVGIGARAAEIALRLLETEASDDTAGLEPASVLVEPRLVVRASSA